MDLGNIDFKQFLPLWMADDETAQAFAFAVQKQLEKAIAQIAQASLYSRIDVLSDELLDEIAWQYNIIEYSSILPIVSKRYLIKNCMRFHAIRGTKAAVENIVNNVFGSGYVEEWFEYSGDQGKFKVHTTNRGTSDEMVAHFDRSIDQAKNVRSQLEAVIVETVNGMDMNFAGYGETIEYITI